MNKLYNTFEQKNFVMGMHCSLDEVDLFVKRYLKALFPVREHTKIVIEATEPSSDFRRVGSVITILVDDGFDREEIFRLVESV